jgi:hypothetical protein
VAGEGMCRSEARPAAQVEPEWRCADVARVRALTKYLQDRRDISQVREEEIGI